MFWPLSDDTNVILLLYTWLGGERKHKPLTLQEYNLLASWLHKQAYRPRNLTDASCAEMAAQKTELSHERLTYLLERRITLGFYLEEWQRRDFWVLGRGDEVYPERVRKLLRAQAPPVLFGTGAIKLLDQGGVAIIGPDQTMQTSTEQAQRIAELCTQHDCTTIVAGKQETATAALRSAIMNGGAVTVLLQGRMFGAPMDKFFRQAKTDEKIVLLSSRSPVDSRSFTQEADIGDLLLAVCDSAVYVDGTELGTDQYSVPAAMQKLQSQKKCFVWTTDAPTSSARQLLQSGIQPWDLETAVSSGIFQPRQKMNQYESMRKNASLSSTNTTSVVGATKEELPPNSEETLWEVGIQLELFPSQMDWEDFLSKDAIVILLLCTPLETGARHTPLNLKEFYEVHKVLQQRQWNFGTLRDEVRMLEISADAKISHERIRWLLDYNRDIKLGANLNKWEQLHHAWVLTYSDHNYPETHRNEIPPLVFGTGNQGILKTSKLAIIGPDSVPKRSGRKALEMAREAVEQGQTIIAAGHLKMAREIVDTVLVNDGLAIWILYDAALKKRFDNPYRQAISKDRLTMITAQVPSYPEPSGEEEMVGRLAVELTDELLYIDGVNSQTKRDRFKTHAAVLRRPEICRFFHGSFVSPGGRELLRQGVKLWNIPEEEPQKKTDDEQVRLNYPPALFW